MAARMIVSVASCLASIVLGDSVVGGVGNLLWSGVYISDYGT